MNKVFQLEIRILELIFFPSISWQEELVNIILLFSLTKVSQSFMCMIIHILASYKCWIKSIQW